MSGAIWTRDEHLIVLDLYINHPEIVEDTSDATVQEVADQINRSPDSVVFRLGNYRYLDPRSTQGLSNISKGCRDIWEDYYGNEDELAYEAERARQRLRTEEEEPTDGDTGTEERDIETGVSSTEGTHRHGQCDFRAAVRERYQDSCLLCDVSTPGLLQAGHILPWSEFEELRGDPKNGLLLCYTHHRAFDLGLFTITESHDVIVRPGLSDLGAFLNRTLDDAQTVVFPKDAPPSDYFRQRNERLEWWPPGE
ncbi:hypothetical protein BRD20_08795 [Halobacteriales archaeon SW_8_65_20]|nr:MAG: hypothetical protein BRD20_08795 [Halobacteriales archaeon SW_8_65_20]